MDIAYIAGFFDGEGSIGMYPRPDRRSYNVRMQLAQNKSAVSLRLFHRLRDQYGGNVSEQTTLSGRTKLNWQLSARGIVQFLGDVTTHLVIKKAQAELVLTWLDHRPDPPRDARGRMTGFDPAFLRYTEDVSRRLKVLKKEG